MACFENVKGRSSLNRAEHQGGGSYGLAHGRDVCVTLVLYSAVNTVRREKREAMWFHLSFLSSSFFY